ncbi:MAG: hypothetical protein A2Z16_08385 [Chloroflexi bacterium RBG_16_54_18]|nr:MAG: hypothetical protein A2Z16_08385 [Chloroflexi bacterium RBG_16_54_18]
MNLPRTNSFPDDPESLPPARRRRASRLLAPLDVDERAALFDKFAHRLSPTFDFYIFSLISGAILSLALMADNQAFLLLGIILAPMMAPVIGISLGTVIGSTRLFLRNLVGMLLGSLIVFSAAFLITSLLRVEFPGEKNLAQAHTRFSWPDFLVLFIGSVFTTIFLARRNDGQSSPTAPLASLALAYTLYLPLAGAGIGLGARLPYLWPDGLVVYLLHFICAISIGAIVLAVLGFRPLSPFGYTIGGAVALAAILLALGMGSFSAVVTARIGLPTATFTLTPTPTATYTPTSTSVPPTATLTMTVTSSLTITPSITPSITPTPVLGLVRSDISQGARIRSEPGGQTVGFLAQNTWVVLLPETVEQDGIIWIQVVAPDGTRGWLVSDLVLRVTPTLLPSP